MLITVQEFARVCRRSPRTVRRWVREGAVTPVRLPSGGLLIPVDELARGQYVAATAGRGRRTSDRRTTT